MATDPDRASRQRSIVRSVRRLPADLAAVVVVVSLTGFAIFTPVVKETPLRILVGLPFVLFVPGYAFIAALFPDAPPEDGTEDDTADGDDVESADADVTRRLSLQRNRKQGSIDGIERVALSFGTSIAIVPLIGLVLNFTPWGIRLAPIYVAVGGFTLGAVAVATRRRFALPPEVRFRVPYEEWFAVARSELLEPETSTDQVLNVLLVVSVLLATASVAYAVAVPKQGESFTEFYVLTENETGDLVADDYPTEYAVGEPKPITVGLGNNEHQDMNYGVVVALQRVEVSNNTTRVLEEDELQRFDAAVPNNETWHRQINVTPTMTGQRMRLTFLLYREAPPPEPTVENAYRELHLWVNVTAEQNASARSVPA